MFLFTSISTVKLISLALDNNIQGAPWVRSNFQKSFKKKIKIKIKKIGVLECGAIYCINFKLFFFFSKKFDYFKSLKVQTVLQHSNKLFIIIIIITFKNTNKVMEHPVYNTNMRSRLRTDLANFWRNCFTLK